MRRALSGEPPGQNPPPLRTAGDTANSGNDNRGDSRGARDGDGGAEETKADVKARGGGEGGRGGDGRRGSGGVADEKVSCDGTRSAWVNLGGVVCYIKAGNIRSGFFGSCVQVVRRVGSTRVTQGVVVVAPDGCRSGRE